MNDLITIVLFEKRTLIRGFFITFLLVFPFTFLPTLFTYGFSAKTILVRFPDSTLYTFCFSLLIVVAAVIQNYNSLVDRKKLFDKPAFKKLDFYGRLDGIGSVVSELETFLLGKVGNYYFRLKIVDPDLKDFKVVVVPLLDLEGDDLLKKKLIKEYGFKEDLVLGIPYKLSESDLDDEEFLLHKLLKLNDLLNEVGAKQLAFDERILDE
ncbi:MAG: hypothetical protein LPJ89_08650 [Hymenobacteraceae bacterium]|nr:hypothetical protein [Hymenobacteraceae bacterium]